MTSESALVVFIPAAEPLVEPFRRKYDPSAAAGIPAHVTVLYPFLLPDLLDEAVLRVLRGIFRRVPAFDVSFLKTMQFSDGLFLEPMPSEPFRRLTRSVFRHFPAYPPYGGAFDQIIPHLTIALSDDPKKIARIALRFEKAARDRLPIRMHVDAVALVENASGVWLVRALFGLKNS